MALGPVDFIVVRFPGTDFSVDIAAAMNSLIDSGTIHVIDLLFLLKDAQGSVSVKEITDLDDVAYLGWDPVAEDVFGYLTQDDALLLADSLEPGSSAVLVLIENIWAAHMSSLIAQAKGEVVISERIPRPVVEELVRLH